MRAGKSTTEVGGSEEMFPGRTLERGVTPRQKEEGGETTRTGRILQEPESCGSKSQVASATAPASPLAPQPLPHRKGDLAEHGGEAPHHHGVHGQPGLPVSTTEEGRHQTHSCVQRLISG